MAIDKDPRFDVLLADVRGDGTVVDQLGLLLRETAPLDFGIQMVSPFAGQLSQGDMQDANLSRWTVRTQRDWSGGQGYGYAYSETDKFQEALAETRFRNQIMLPPQVTQTTVSAPTDPQFQPGGSTNNSSLAVGAAWTARTPVSQQASASWSSATRSAATVSAYGGWTAGSRIAWVQSSEVSSAISLTSGFPVAMAFTLANTTSVDSITTWIDAGFTATSFWVDIVADSGGNPTGSTLASKTNTPVSGLNTFTLASPVLLSSGTTYWVKFNVSGGGCGLRYNTTYSGACKQYNGSSWVTVGGGAKGAFEVWGTSYTQDAGTWQGQRFLAPGALTMTTMYLRLARSGSWASGTTLTLELRTAGTSSVPGSVSTSATYAVDPGTSATWIPFTLSSSLVASTYYWLVLKVTTTATNNVTILWHGDANQGYKPGGVSQPGYSSTNSGGAWSSTSKCYYFYANSGYSDATPVPYFQMEQLSRVRLESTFTANVTVAMTQMKLYVDRTVWTGSPTLRLRIMQGASQVATATAADPGASIVWWQFTASVTLTNAVAYTIIVEVDAPATTDAATIRVYGEASTTASIKTLGVEAHSWSTTSSPTWRPFFLVNSSTNYPVASTVYYFTHTGLETRRGMQFTVGGSPVTMTFVRLRLKRVTWQGSPTLTLRLFSNSANLPNAQLDTASITSAMFDSAGAVTTDAWVQITMSEALSASTSYHLVLDADAPTVADSLSVEWYGDTLLGYGSNQASSSTATDGLSFGSWGAVATLDHYFMINNGSPLTSSVTVNPCRFITGWYVAAGTTIYKWNTGTVVWDVVHTAGAAVTALCDFNGKLYAALGDSTDMLESSNGTVWSAVAGSKRYTYLREYGGYMYGAKSVGSSTAVAYFNGSAWADIQAGDASTAITGLGTLQNELVVLSTGRMWSLSGRWLYQIANYEAEEAAASGVNAIQWVADGRLYVPLRNGLNAYDGSRLTPVGPETTEGLPSGEQGRVAAMAGTKNWLFAAIDAGASGRSAIYAYDGKGWHCMVKATATARRIRAIGVESITASSGFTRIWWWEDSTPNYLELPDLTDNPYAYTGAKFASSGTLTSSRMGGELAQIVKDIQSVSVRSENCTTARKVEVWLEVDGTGIWTKLGDVTQSPHQEIETSAGNMANKTTAAGSTASVINIALPGSTSDCTPGAFIRIGSEVGQIASVQTATQFTLAIPLREAPAAGVTVFPSRPAGREVRYRLVLNTDSSSQTPLVRRVSFRWQEQILDLFRLSMGVQVGTRLKCRTGGDRLEYSADELRDAIYLWMRRSTPFVLVDPTGRNWTVKCRGGSESGFTREDGPEKAARLRSTISLQFDEVSA